MVLIPTISCEIIKNVKKIKTHSATDEPEEEEKDVKFKQAYTREKLSSN